MKNFLFVFFVGTCFLFLQSCSVTKQINTQAHKILLQDSVINTGHIGISIYEPATNRYWYNYNADKYFVPASNTKLFTLYAGMKYLGDSLVGIRYTDSNLINIDSIVPFTNLVKIFPSGDPTFLDPAYKCQPVFEFLKKQKHIELCDFNKVEPYGKGWAWDDYQENYMPPRSPFPMYKNAVNITFVNKDSIDIQPPFFKKELLFSLASDTGFSASRAFSTNQFWISPGLQKAIKIPIYPQPAAAILMDTLKQTGIGASSWRIQKRDIERNYKIIYSQPTDSLLAPMMHNSDNFFAEQVLLMAGNEQLGYMNEQAIIDTLIKTVLKDVPQQPNWVDGSGLSRYNLFTPLSFVYILNKMKKEFGWHRLKKLLPTGGQGTLKNYYNSDSSFIYAKTGSLSNQIALSGFLLTKKNKLLVFSLLANNAVGDGWRVRRAYERFLKNIREQY